MKQKSVYERYTLKQKIDISKRAETMRTLNSELKKSKELAKQLTEIAKQTEIKPGETNAMSLRSSSWYSKIVQEQLETSENRNKFLQQEIDDSRKILAKAVHRKNKSEEAWHRYEAVEQADKEDKFEQDLLGRKRNISKFGN
jgi:CRISPR/Cas system CSM-associated protein Csm2 small subunit|tara:strand:- start:22 stop:447 length:426 start_codon:yes stop_codon:yes gene_type:complete